MLGIYTKVLYLIKNNHHGINIDSCKWNQLLQCNGNVYIYRICNT